MVLLYAPLTLGGCCASMLKQRRHSHMAESESFFGSMRRFFRDYLLAVGSRGTFGHLVQRATEDAALRQRLLQAPGQVLAESGIRLPEGLEVEFLENTDKVVHLVLPPFVGAAGGEGGEP